MKDILILALLALAACTHEHAAAVTPPPPPPPPPPVAAAPQPTDKTMVARGVREKLALIQSCYETALKRDPGLAGKVVVRFTIGTEGRVTSTEVVESNLPASVGDCIRSNLQSLAYPVHLEHEVTVSFPFVFSPNRS